MTDTAVIIPLSTLEDTLKSIANKHSIAWATDADSIGIQLYFKAGTFMLDVLNLGPYPIQNEAVTLPESDWNRLTQINLSFTIG